MSTYNFKKAMTHIGFEINSGIPRKIFLTTGKGGERPFVIKILEQGETGVLDRGYQSHNNFDSIQARRQAFRLPDQNQHHENLSEQPILFQPTVPFL